MQAQTFDITKLLQKGRNTVCMHIGPGWYASGLGWPGTSVYGKTTTAICEI